MNQLPLINPAILLYYHCDKSHMQVFVKNIISKQEQKSKYKTYIFHICDFLIQRYNKNYNIIIIKS